MGKKETYPEARLRLFEGLSKAGVTVKPGLKIPQAKFPSGETVYFRKQAVYLEAHSLWIDIRGMNLETFMAAVLQAKQIRKTVGDAACLGYNDSRVLVRAATH